jgi:hypothetical protein
LLHDDDDILAEQGEEADQPLGREAGKLPAQQPGYLRLVDPEQRGSLGLRQPTCADGGSDLHGKVGLREAFLRVRQAEIGKHIAAAFLDLEIILHILSPSTVLRQFHADHAAA